MKIESLMVKKPYKPLTIHSMGGVSFYGAGTERHIEYTKNVLEARAEMSEKLSEFDDVFLEKLFYKEYGVPHMTKDDAEYVIECIILVRTN